MLLAVHNLYPALRPFTSPFFQLSYYQPAKGVYLQGLNDVYFVASSAIAFTAIRAMAIDWVFQPLACRAGLKKKAALRVAEQGWLWVYYGFFWTFGMVSSAFCRVCSTCLFKSNRCSISGRILRTGWTIALFSSTGPPEISPE